MLAVLTTIVVLAAVFGFVLSVYFFFYVVNIAKPLRWLAGIIGGIFTGALMAMLAFIVLWPPVNFPVIAAALAFAGLVAAVALGWFGKSRDVECTSSSISLNRGDEHEDLDTYGLDVDARAGS